MSTHDTLDAPPSTAQDSATAAADGPRDEKKLVAHSVTIGRPRQELYAYWRDLPNLATFMSNIESITKLDDRRSHWVVKAPAGQTVEWDAVITRDEDGSLLEWQSEDGADIRNSGRVEFRDAQGDRGTIVTATIAYDPPGGTIGALIAKLFQREPAIQARRELRRFKQLMETGEITNSTSSLQAPHKA